MLLVRSLAIRLIGFYICSSTVIFRANKWWWWWWWLRWWSHYRGYNFTG